MGTHPIFESDFDCLTDGHFGMRHNDDIIFAAMQKFAASPAERIVEPDGQVVFNLPPVIEPESNRVLFPESKVHEDSSRFDKIIKLIWDHSNLTAFRNILASRKNPDHSLFRWSAKSNMSADVEPSTPLIRYIINRFYMPQAHG